MDIEMPLLDGFEASRQIREFNKTVIIIAQTAYSFIGNKEKALAAGFNDFISKPISKPALMEIIKKHIRR
jgi:CheY-like chemotaxis protein